MGDHSKALLFSLLLLSVLLLRISSAQMQGFLSLDCGGRENFTDNLGLKWVPDEDYLFGETTSISVPSETRRQYSTLRYFPPDGRKYCYTLNVKRGRRYLVRASFLYGNFDNNEVYPKFQLYFGATYWSTIVILDPDTIEFRELIFLAADPVISVCLSNVDTGMPFISTIELRQFDRSMYSTKYERRFHLAILARINFGARSEVPIRYPDDPYDRIWESDHVKKLDFLVDMATGTKNVSTEIPLSVDCCERPPEKIMRTAVVGSDGILAYQVHLSEYPGFGLVLAYIAEIEDVGVDEIRKFSVKMLDAPVASELIVSVEENSRGRNRLYEPRFDNTSLSPNFGFKFERMLDSSRGPLLNAMEIGRYAMKRTGSPDFISSIVSLYPSAKWAQEGGDPCLPNPWSWIRCNSESPPRIVQIVLQRKNLTGEIPTVFTKLDHLVELWLNGNSFTGTIPDFSRCLDLKIIHLENNQLSGKIPSSLGNLPKLRILYLDNNFLSGSVPFVLRHENLMLSVSGNHVVGDTKRPITAIIVACILGILIVLALVAASCRKIFRGTTQHRGKIEGISLSESRRGLTRDSEHTE